MKNILIAFTALLLTSHCESFAQQYYESGDKCNNDIYAGKDRAVAKTHPVTGHLRTFNTFDDFYNSGLIVRDATMLARHISKDPESPRVAEETINVDIKEAYIYGIYREDDNDYHMIIGNGEVGANMHLFNAEISAFPEEDDASSLHTVRNRIINMFGDLSCGDDSYKPVEELIPIRIKGSLFFDVDHPAGRVGFGVYKPRTAWEIHPVTLIQFL